MKLPSDQDGDLAGIDPADAFLKHFLPKDAETPSDKGKDEEDDDAPKKPVDESEDDADEQDSEGSDESPEQEDDGDDSGDEDNKDKRKYAEDDDATYVKIKVEDVEHEVSVKDLKRLWGQESALTQKSQKVAEQRKAVETELTKYGTAAATLLQRAQARFEPFSKVDFVLAAKELSPEEYTALRNEAQKAYEDVQFLQSEVETVVKTINNQSQTALVEQAREAVKVLSSDPKDGGIDGWSEKLYDDIRAYAVTNAGIPAEVVNKLVDPAAIRVLHKAMLFDRGTSKVTTTKVNKTPKKVVKTSNNPETTKQVSKKSKKTDADKRLAKDGSTDSAADAFLARWESDDE